MVHDMVRRHERIDFARMHGQWLEQLAVLHLANVVHADLHGEAILWRDILPCSRERVQEHMRMREVMRHAKVIRIIPVEHTVMMQPG